MLYYTRNKVPRTLTKKPFALKLQVCTIKKRCNYCNYCKLHHKYQQRSTPHINKIASFSTQTAILHYQKTAEIVEKVEIPWHNAITAVITASRKVWGLYRDAACDG